MGSVAALVGLGAIGAALAAPACTVLTNDALPDDAGIFEGGAGDADAVSSACGTCVAQECVGTWAVCLTDERCHNLRACDTPFGESKGARDACLCAGSAASDAGVDPLAAYLTFASCNSARTCTKCATDCPSGCTASGPPAAPTCGVADAGTDAPSTEAGGVVNTGGDAGTDGPSVDRCATCVGDRCSAKKALCAIGSECAAFLACAHRCGDASCVAACGNAHSSGKAGATELSNCTLSSCRSACGL